MSRVERILLRPLLVAFLLVPVAVLVVLSIGANWSWPGVLPGTWTSRHWSFLVRGDNPLAAGAGLSLLLAVCVSVASTGLGFFTSKKIAYHRHGQRLLLASYAPYVLSPILYAIWIHLFFVRFDLAGSLWGVMVGQFLLAYPYAVIFFQGFWSRGVKNLEDAGLTLGASRWQVMRRVVLPVARGMGVICLFQCFLISWFEFGLTSLIGVGKVKTLPILIYAYVQEADLHLAALACLILVVPVGVVAWWNRQIVVTKKSIGAGA